MKMKSKEIKKEQIASELEELLLMMHTNKLKQVDKRLRVIKMYVEGKTQSEIANKLDYTRDWVRRLIKQYQEKGLAEYARHKYGGNHRNMSEEDEIALLSQFEEASNSGNLVVANTIKKAFDEKLGRDTGSGYIYMLLKRHKARKLAPRPVHPKKASDAVIDTAKKLTLDTGN